MAGGAAPLGCLYRCWQGVSDVTLYSGPSPERDAAEQDAGAPGSSSGAENDFSPERWIGLVTRIRDKEAGALEELYRVFSKGIRYYLCRHLGPQELDDKVHDTFLIVVQSIQGGGLREPEKLMGFVRTVVRRQVAGFIAGAVQSRREFADLELGVTIADGGANPEQRVLSEERADVMMKVLRGISRRDREILTRFYLYEQPQAQICEEMDLTETQFRLLKSRAKTRFAELGRKRIGPAKLSQQTLRKTAGFGH